jgi:hypothetical protein
MLKSATLPEEFGRAAFGYGQAAADPLSDRLTRRA